ncbi:MAG: serpin family protein [Candidatus Limnocylindrales bacterium]
MSVAVERRVAAGRFGTWIARLGVLTLAGSVLWSCAGQAAANDVARSSASRAGGSAAEAGQAASALNAFGFDLYRTTASAAGNEVFSPVSIELALAMARAGAAGATASEMDSVMHAAYGSGNGNGLNSLDQALAGLSGSYPNPLGSQQTVRLHVANAPFAQRGYSLKQPYLDTLAGRFDAGLRLADFADDPTGSCKLINDWIRDQTEDRIPKLLDGLDPLTRLVLANAIYMKAPWQAAFWPEGTKDSPFTRLDGTQVTVPTMSLSLASATYASGPGWQAAELGYVGGSLAMTLILPDDLPTFEKKLDATLFDHITGALRHTSGELTLPRFKTETRIDLNQTLATMGMPSAFDAARADFSGITDQERLFISKVVHQANISVDEKGTEASAATVVVIAVATSPPDLVTFHVDRPFVFAVRDRSTGAILFLGRIVDPSA